LDKVRAIRTRLDASGHDIDLEVDGGINIETAPAVIEAGANVLVAGTATFEGGAGAYADNIARLKGAAG
jgi:ribulose-phosphate 3-epimerase